MKKIITLLALSILFLTYCGNSIQTRVMTFNIRYASPDDGVNIWENRRDLVADVFGEKAIDIAGMQEVTKPQLDYLIEKLPEYDFYGVGRDDGKEAGEYCPVMFKKTRYELLEKNTFWLSETPGLPGNLCWDTVCNRVCSWVKLKDKQSNKVFYFFNTHFSHVSDEARKKSADMLLAEIAKIVGDSKVIVTGDFNLTCDTEAYQKLVNNPLYKLFDTANLGGYNFTETDHSFNGWGKSGWTGVIDYIFVSTGITVDAYEIYYKKVGEIYVSDHFPVISIVTI